MPTTLSPTPADPSGHTLSTPADTEDANAASVDGAFQLILNWIQWLRARVVAVNTGSVAGSISYTRNSAGTVHVWGDLAGGTSATIVGTLPAGYRPLTQMEFDCPVYNSSLATFLGLGAVIVGADGSVSVSGYTRGRGGSGLISAGDRLLADCRFDTLNL
jgi:hypothetical protein